MKKIAIAMLFISISMYTGMANAAYGNVPPQPLYPILNYYVRDLYKSFKNIPEERRYRLDEMVRYVENQQRMGRDAQIFFLGYDQPEVVQMLNIWSETAAFFFNLENISFFSGTEKAGNISDPAILALEKAGFIIYKTSLDGGQLYKVKYSYNLKPHFVFQKKIDHVRNPRRDYYAVITDENIQILAAKLPTLHKLTLTYTHPDALTGLQNSAPAYNDLCRQMAVEMFYVYAQLKGESF